MKGHTMRPQIIILAAALLLSGCATMFDRDVLLARNAELAAKAQDLHERFEANPNYTRTPERTRWYIGLLTRSVERIPVWIDRGDTAKAYYQLNDTLALAHILDRELRQLQGGRGHGG